MIVLYYANRAEKSILDPVKKEIDRRGLANKYIDLSLLVEKIENDKNLANVYSTVYEQIERLNIKKAVVIGDRREIMFAVLALFIRQVPVIQLASGDLCGKISLVDDYFRHLITLMSSKQVCFTDKSKQKSDDLLKTLNLERDSIFLNNPTLSDIDISSLKKDSLGIYDLVLVHPQSLSFTCTHSDAETVKNLINPNKETIIIKGNKDKNYKILHDLWDDLAKNKNVRVFKNLEKKDFLIKLANCDRFITNSSCAYYEAPLFLKEKNIIRVGNRNSEREIADYNINKMKSSKEIVDFIVGGTLG
jgi:UDP-N-acetylglucosamine 2-epimerase